MLETFFEASFTLKRLRLGPSGRFIDGFAQYLKGKGYSWWTSRRYLRCAAHLGRFLETEARDLRTVDEAILVASRQHFPRCECPLANGGTTKDSALGARAFVEYLSGIGVATQAAERAGEDHEPAVVASFRHWLQQHKNAAESTQYHYCRSAAKLLAALGDDPSEYESAGLRSFILARARRSGPGATKTLITGVRTSLRLGRDPSAGSSRKR
ncbi:MAG: hypothetical protein GY719_20055 [bacterium]|nr:hypothetical protein [bacterium]